MFIFINNVFAENTHITSFNLNGLSQSAKFNPQNGDEVLINIEMSASVKITRVYICYLEQECNGSKGNYVRYFSPGATTSSVSISWNGKVSTASNALFANEGEYRVMVSFYENGSATATNIFGQNNISVNFSGAGNIISTSTLESINITTFPTKTSYGIGDLLDISGMVVTGTYSDNSTLIEPVTVKDISGFNSSTSTSSQILTILYKDKITTFPVIISTTVPIVIIKIVNHYSTHYISEDLSTYAEEEILKISAGRERIAYVGTPISFTAKHDLINKNPYFNWSFGDATENTGEEITHIYKHPGEYFVVLNGVNGNGKAVSRTSVKVLEPKMTLSIKSNNLEIKNNGEYEINIGGWKIKDSKSEFLIPKDTIIDSNNFIILSASDIGFSFGLDDIVKIEDQSVDIIAFTKIFPGDVIAVINNSSSTVSQNISNLEGILGIKIGEAEKLVVNYKKGIIRVDNNQILSTSSVFLKSVLDSNQKKDNEDVKKVQDVAVIDEVVNSTTTVGFWKNMINLPSSGIKSIIKVFYDF